MIVVVVVAAASSCVVFLPESTDRVELATAQAKSTCTSTESGDPAFILDPQLIESVEPLYSVIPSKSGHDTHLMGAKLRMRPTPGMTPELLERTLRCHGARQTLRPDLAAATAATTTDPYLLPNGWMKIKVESMDSAFMIHLSSRDHESAKEILTRAGAFFAARRLTAPGSGPGLGSKDAGAENLPPSPPQ